MASDSSSSFRHGRPLRAAQPAIRRVADPPATHGRRAACALRPGHWLGALCLCALLAGCVHATKARFTGHYGLGAVAPATQPTSRASTGNGKILEIAPIEVPEWLADTAMYYRLEYRNDDRLAAYAESDWIAPPAALLEPILRQRLAAGGWRAVVGPRNPATADVSLQLRLDDFSQTFAGPATSNGVIDATATLVDGHDAAVIAQKRFHIEVPAATADAQGGARALAEASHRFAARLQRWVQSTTAGRAQPHAARPNAPAR